MAQLPSPLPIVCLNNSFKPIVSEHHIGQHHMKQNAQRSLYFSLQYNPVNGSLPYSHPLTTEIDFKERLFPLHVLNIQAGFSNSTDGTDQSTNLSLNWFKFLSRTVQKLYHPTQLDWYGIIRLHTVRPDFV